MLQVTLKCFKCGEVIQAPLEVADGIPDAYIAHRAASHTALSRADAAEFAGKWASVVAYLAAHRDEHQDEDTWWPYAPPS